MIERLSDFGEFIPSPAKEYSRTARNDCPTWADTPSGQREAVSGRGWLPGTATIMTVYPP
jgi:hypothetical protein